MSTLWCLASLIAYSVYIVVFGVSYCVGWWGGAKVLGNLPVPGRPINLDYSKARACCACSRCGGGCLDFFFSHLSFLSTFSLSLGDGPI